MLSLTHGLDSTICTEIGEMPINLMFDNVLQWYKITDQDDMELPDKLVAGWRLFINAGLNFNTLEDYETAANALEDISEYIAADPYVENDEQSDMAGNDVDPVQCFSYEQDAEAIYASFMFDYHIDLIEQQGRLRWEKFRALFNNLSAKSPMMRIIDIRQRDTVGLEGKALSDLVEAQQYYALEGQSADQLNQAFGSMFDMLKVQAQAANKD